MFAIDYASIYAFTNAFVYIFVYAFDNAFVNAFTNASVYTSVYTFTYSFVYAFAAIYASESAAALTRASKFETTVFDWSKQLTQLKKTYKMKKKFNETNDNFEFKLIIFFEKCRRVELSFHVYLKSAFLMLSKKTLNVFYVIDFLFSRLMNFVDQFNQNSKISNEWKWI